MKRSEEMESEIYKYFAGEIPLASIKLRFNVTDYILRQIINGVISMQVKSVRKNWLYDIRMKEALKNRTENFTQQQISTQLF